MPGLADLFSAEDFKSKGKGTGSAKKDAGKKKGAKEKTTVQKGVRYPLPVRVATGHIRCRLTKEEYPGKTVGEDDIKKKIRAAYPELSGVNITLVKFENDFTKAAEAVEKKQALDADKKEAEEDPLDIAAAEKAESMEDGDQEDDERDSYEEGGPEDDYEDGSESDSEGDFEEDSGEEASDAEHTAVEENVPGNEKGCWIKLEIHYEEFSDSNALRFPVTVKVGEVSAAYGEGYTSLEDVRSNWVVQHPEYAGCLFHYDDKQGILLPFMHGESEVKGRKYKLPLSVGYLGIMEHYRPEDFAGDNVESVTIQQIRDLYGSKYPEYGNALFACHEEQGILFPVLNFKKTDENMLYSVPVKVRGGGFILELDSSDFQGRSEVSLEDIRRAIEAVYPEFSKERTEMIYDERGFVIPVLKGSKKGYHVISSRPGCCLIQTVGRNGMAYRVEQTPFGFFDCREDGMEVDFLLDAPKIPGALLQEIITYFKRDPDREAAVQVFYDEKNRAYELYYPKQKAGAASVVFERNTAMEEEKVLVMDVHSHNRMDAFFSGIDDRDEKGTRLYLVIGKIDTKKPAWCFRAGIAGHYKYLNLRDVFTMEGVTYGL